MPSRTSPDTVCTRTSPPETALTSTSPDVVEIPSSPLELPIVTSPDTDRAVIDASERPSMTSPDTVTSEAFAATEVDVDVPAGGLDLELAEDRLEPGVARCRADRHLAELAVCTKVGRPSRELEVRAGRTGDPALEVASPRDLDRAPAEAILLLHLDDVAAEALFHRDFDLVDGVLASTADRDDLDGRVRLVGRRDQDATTRELDLEGDAPGRFEDVHRLTRSGRGRPSA